ncbi:MAG: hypothetical protein JO053_13175 [Acidobacteria bacterium]|nr:hypothetical protein [Acidobacteriota bacterium]
MLTGCGGAQPAPNRPISLVGDEPSEFPFSTKEPELYQADIVITTGDKEDKFFVARNRAKWRLDFFENGQPTVTEMNSDNRYTIDHQAKSYKVVTGGPLTVRADDMARSFFRGKEYRDFEDMGSSGGIKKWRVVSDNDNIVISIDEASGLIVKEEFNDKQGSPQMTYELRNLKLAVDDSVFQIPVGYKKKSN